MTHGLGIANPIDVEKSLVFHIIGGSSTDNVWYEVVDGQVIRHLDTLLYMLAKWPR